MPSTLLQDLVKTQSEIPEILKSITTHCFQLRMEALKTKTENFEVVDSHYTVDGLLVTYKCNLDGRQYYLHITADK